jgi:anti-anti-sigma factor
LATQPVPVIIAAPGLTFIDSSVLAALAHAHGAAFEAGVGVAVREPSPELQRTTEITGLEDLLSED